MEARKQVMRQFFASLREDPALRRRAAIVTGYAGLTAVFLFWNRGLFAPGEGEDALIYRCWLPVLFALTALGAGVGLGRIRREAGEERKIRLPGPVQLIAILANAAALFGMIESVNNTELADMM